MRALLEIKELQKTFKIKSFFVVTTQVHTLNVILLSIVK